MNKDMLSKTLIISIVLLFFGISITPTIGISNSFDDTTPPVTTISLDPLEPDGLNGWYVNDVNVMLNATDDMSGVNITKYRINNQPWRNYIEPFILSDDGYDIVIEFYSVDNAGNQEPYKQTSINLDQTDPDVDIYFEIAEENSDTIIIDWCAFALDDMSSMERVEFYLWDELQKIIYGNGPIFRWEGILLDVDFSFVGLINKINITDEYVKFYAIVVQAYSFIVNESTHLGTNVLAYDEAGNMEEGRLSYPPPKPPPKEYFKWYTLPNDYEGYIGNYFISASFEKKPTNITIGINNLNIENTRLTNRIPFHTLLLRLIERFPIILEVISRLINPVR